VPRLAVAIVEPDMSAAFFSKAADLYPLLLLALAVQQRYFAFTDPDKQSPTPLLALFVYVVMGGGATLLAIGDPSLREGCLPYTVAGLAGLVFSLAMSSVFPAQEPAGK
jgi:hypothetical protein